MEFEKSSKKRIRRFVVVNLPAGHDSHSVFPVSVVTFPGGQGTQRVGAPAFALKKFFLHG